MDIKGILCNICASDDVIIYAIRLVNLSHNCIVLTLKIASWFNLILVLTLDLTLDLTLGLDQSQVKFGLDFGLRPKS